MFEVRCGACLRVEEWEGSERVRVRIEGGGRRPSEAPALAAWRTLADARDRGRTVLGACSACGQPLTTAAKGVAAIPYAIDLPGTDVRFDGLDFVGAHGAIGRDAARQRIAAALPPPPPADVGRMVFTTYAAGLGGIGFVLWIAGATFVLFFLIRGAQTGALWGQRGTGIYEKDLRVP